MLKNIHKFEFKERKPHYNFEVFYYAQAAKKERLLKNWTLDYVSNAFCSISYMSKFENHLINPDKYFLKELDRIYGVKFKNEKLEITQEMLDKVLSAFIHNDFEQINNMYQELKEETFNVPRALILAFYYLLNKDEENLKKQITELDLIKNSLTNQEQILLLFIVMQYKLETHDFTDMVYYLSCFDKVELLTFEEKWMLAYIEMLYGYHMDDLALILKHNKVLFNDLNMHYPTGGKVIANLVLLENISRKSFKAVINEVEAIYLGVFTEPVATDITYLRYLILLNGHKYEEVFEQIIEKDLMYDNRFLALLGYCVFKMPTENNILRFENLVKEKKNEKIKQIHDIFIGFISLVIKKQDENIIDIIELMKFKIIPYNNSHRHVLYSRVYYEYYINLLRNDSKYKDTVSFMINY